MNRAQHLLLLFSLIFIQGLSAQSIDELVQKIKAIPEGIIPYTLSEWGIQENDLPQLVEESFTKGRMDNNIVDLTKDQVFEVLKSIK